jgi:hypothetical protein
MNLAEHMAVVHYRAVSEAVRRPIGEEFGLRTV